MQAGKVRSNILLSSDSYKIQHPKMSAPGTERVWSYFQSRLGAEFDVQKMACLQPMLIEHFCTPFTYEEMLDFFVFSTAHGCPAPEDKVRRLFEKYHGYLPIEIRAIPEGMVLPINNALITVENTDDEFPWVTNYIETELSHIWYPIYVATLSYMTRKLIKGYLEETADDLSMLNWMHHNFGDRGATCREAAMIAGMAHAMAGSKGTDSIIGCYGAWKYYDAPRACSFSVAATEHSIMTSMGREGEKEVFRYLLERFPDGILSIVIDSYDYTRFISEYALEFRDIIMARKGKVVFRPDSGCPVTVSFDVYNRLAKVFGETLNTKGYRILPPQVGILWGDGIKMKGIGEILENFKRHNISASNIVFGQGGGLVQSCTRDSMRSAFKCSAQKQYGKWVDIQKDPLDSSKKSMAGRLKVIAWEGSYKTVKVDDPTYLNEKDILVTVFRNGELLKKWSWEEVLAWNDAV
jgi:nicotinamide phosphoribosyltransferase